jgi:hypothetical protein
MELTKSQLKQIIQEELDSILKDVEAKEDSWAGGENLENPVDYQKITTGRKKEKKK